MRINLNKQATNLPWPPTPPATEPRQVTSGSSLDLCVACGDSHSTFTFSLYKYPAKQSGPNDLRVKLVCVALFTDITPAWLVVQALVVQSLSSLIHHTLYV